MEANQDSLYPKWRHLRINAITQNRSIINSCLTQRLRRNLATTSVASNGWKTRWWKVSNRQCCFLICIRGSDIAMVDDRIKCSSVWSSKEHLSQQKFGCYRLTRFYFWSPIERHYFKPQVSYFGLAKMFSWDSILMFPLGITYSSYATDRQEHLIRNPKKSYVVMPGWQIFPRLDLFSRLTKIWCTAYFRVYDKYISHFYLTFIVLKLLVIGFSFLTFYFIYCVKF